MPSSSRSWTSWGYLAAGVAGGYVAYKLTRYLQQRASQEKVLAELEEKMVLSKEKMMQIRDEIIAEMELGLQCKKSSLLMLPSMVDFLPTGKEAGKFLSIDIGGSNFRVTAVELLDRHGETGAVKVEEQRIPPEVRHCHQTKLFDWMAQSTIDFCKNNHIHFGDQLPTVGFCFSFPVEQTEIDNGRLVKWNKGFDVEGSIGEDVVQLLEDAFERCGMPARVAVLINDSVGVLSAARYADEDAQLGVILGTGFNVCYVEDVQRVRTLPEGYKPGSRLMVINMESGGFDGPSLPRLDEDIWLDCASPAPGSQVIEKMMSGLYLGEVVRRLLLRLAEDHGLLGGRDPPTSLMHGANQLTTPHIARMHADDSPDRAVVAEVLDQTLGVHPALLPLHARLVVQRLIALAACRSARLLVATIAAVLHVQGRDTVDGPRRTVVALDGGMYEKYKQYREMVLEAKELLLGHVVSQHVTIRLTPDGSSMGAAGLAAAAMQTSPGGRGQERTLSKVASPSTKRRVARIPAQRQAAGGKNGKR